MAFRKGDHGNPNGRPKGSPNKLTQQRREMFSNFVDENFEKMKTNFSELPMKEQMRFFLYMVPFSLPKLRPTDEEPDTPEEEEIKVDMSKFTDDELRMIAHLQAKAGIIET